MFGSKSSSTAYTVNQSSGADNGALAITAGGSVTMLDGGAIAQAIDLSKTTVQSNQDMNEQYLKGALGLATDSQNMASAANTNALKSSQYAMEQIVAAKAPDNDMVKNVMYSMMAIGALFIVMQMRKK